MNSQRLVLSARFKSFSENLLFGRARLFPDRVELSGFSPSRGFGKRVITLEEIVRVDWWTQSGKSPNLVLRLAAGDAMAIRIDHGGLWKFEIEALRRARAMPRAIDSATRVIT